MKKNLVAIMTAIALCCLLAVAQDNKGKDTSKRVLAGGLVSINTTTLCPDVEGFNGPTPLDIRIKNDTIRDIIALGNEESPEYFNEASKLLKKWIGLTPAKGLDLEVDAVSGATFSSEALIANVRAGLKRALEK